MCPARRALTVAGLFAATGLITLGPAVAGPPLPACATQADLLGVSRIVEIDTADAPRFGAQYDSAGFLEDGEVVLTFDDGPLRTYTKRVLDALDEQCTKATFFVVGRMAIADPDLVKETQRRGHTIGVHTYAHNKLSAVGASRAVEDIELGLSTTAKALGANPAPFFRFPYLRDSKAALSHLRERQIGVFGIDIDSRDFSTRNPAVVQKTVLDQLTRVRKGIILMHDIQTSTAGAIRSLLTELKQRGFRIVHMVPKGTATTLADYDRRAGELLASKMVAAAKNPLASRSVVWPNSAAKPGKTAAAAGEAESVEEVLPWLADQPPQPAPAAPVSPRAPRRPEPPGMQSNPWQTGNF